MIDSILHGLAILGILILCLLGVLLLLLLAVAFVPVRYRFLIDKENGWEKDKIHIDVKVGWLLGLIRLRVKLLTPRLIRVKFLCFTVFDINKPKREKKEKKENKENKEKKVREKAPEEKRASEESRGEIETPPESEPVNHDAQTPNVNGTAAEKLPFWKKIWYTIKRICDNIQYYKELICSQEFKDGVSLVWGRFTSIVLHILPVKLRGSVILGFGEPDKTGYALGVLCIIRGIKGYDNLDIQSDFEQEIFEAKLQGRGRVRLFTLARHAFAVYRDKNLRNLLAHIKREEK